MSPTDQIRTTVVIPVWDDYARGSLESAVRSIVDQGRPFRLLLVDNASTVPVPAIDHAEVIRAPARLTLGDARNLGLGRVQTPYVIFWDADDVMLPGALSALENAVEADPALVAFGMAISESPSGRRHRWPRRYLGWLVQHPRILQVLHCVWSQFPTTGATIIMTDAARSAGGFAATDSGEDWCLGVSLAFRGRVGWTEHAGREYRLHPDSMWAKHLTVRHQLRHAGVVRGRIRKDPGVPAWIRTMLPLIWAGQHLAVGAHVGLSALRGGWGSG